MSYAAVVIGASAGGVTALHRLLAALPATCALPLVIAQHRAPAPDSTLITLWSAAGPLRVKEADEKEPLRPGWVYVAPANYHLLIERDGRLALSIDPKVCFSRPSIDVLFESAADAFGRALVAVLLTGASRDGTDGLRAIKARGGLTIAQATDDAECDAMPRAAIHAHAAVEVLPLSAITARLSRLATAGV